MSSTSFHRTKPLLFHIFQHRFLRTSSSAVVDASTLIPLKNATPTLDQLNPNAAKKHESVRNLFKSYGFTDAHLAKITAKSPKILLAKVEKTLKPKLDYLADYGLSGSFLHELIVLNPRILRIGLNSNLQPTLQLLQTYLGSNPINMTAVKRYSWLLGHGNKETIEQNVNILMAEGLPFTSISKLMTLYPRTLTQRPERTVHAIQSVKQFGFRPADPMFVHAIFVTLCMNESMLAKKIDLVKNLLGCSEEEFNTAFKRFPAFLTCSEEKLKRVTDFFVNTMGVEASVLLSSPEYYGYSVDKRMVPRYNVYKVLKSKKLLKKGTKFPRLLYKTDKWFELKYVVKYLDKVPNLMELYRGFLLTGNNTQASLVTTK